MLAEQTLRVYHLVNPGHRVRAPPAICRLVGHNAINGLTWYTIPATMGAVKQSGADSAFDTTGP